MRVLLSEAAVASLRTIPPEPKKAIRAILRRLEQDPRHADIDWKPLVGSGPHHYFRARFGSYRIVYAVIGSDVYVERIMHRREGYGWLERL